MKKKFILFLVIGMFISSCVSDQLSENIASAPPIAETEFPTNDTGVRKRVMEDFMFGAVYFRKTNPPQEDWANDYQTASEDGHNIFRHWVPWSAVEVEPGVYDWSDYDRHLDLAAENGIHTIMAEMITGTPEFLWGQYPEARLENRDGTPDYSGIAGACLVGGFPGLTLNDQRVRDAAGKFLTAMASRYKDHPGMSGYDLVNEVKFPQSPNGSQQDYSFDPATQQVFRDWLKEKYGPLDSLKQVWRRYSLTSWQQVQAPRDVLPVPEVMDWLEFRMINFHDQMRWRADVLRAADPNHAITAHGKAYGLWRMGTSCNNPWMAADIVDLYGFTWGAHSKGKEPYLQFHAVDLIRSACGEKPFWHAEMVGGPEWPSKRDRDDGKVATPDDIRLWSMVSLAGGAQGILNPRWRPLLDGVLFGAFGFYSMDGSRTNRSEMASTIAKWGSAEEQKTLWKANPVKGDIGILVIPESQLWDHAMFNNRSQYYQRSVFGAYQGFFDNNIQADWVHIKDIEKYDLLYLPYPIHLKSESARIIAKWVSEGGKLISEGCPGYIGNNAHAGETQPNQGLGKVFGVEETYVEFGENIHPNWTITYQGSEIPVGLNHQEYRVTTAKAVGQYQNGALAMAENRYGKGKTLLVGSFPGYRYYKKKSQAAKDFYKGLLTWGGAYQLLDQNVPDVLARLHENDKGEKFIWIVNHNKEDKEVAISWHPSLGGLAIEKVFWGIDESPVINGNTLTVNVQQHDAAVVKLVVN